MPGIPLNFSSGSTFIYCTRISTFFKVAALPTGQPLVLMDIYGPGICAMQINLDSSGTVNATASYRGGNAFGQLNPGVVDESSRAVRTGIWYWASIVFRGQLDGDDHPVANHFSLRGQLFDNTGTTPGLQRFEASVPGDYHESVPCHFGWGVQLSTSGEDDYPDTPGHQLCCAVIETDTGGTLLNVMSPPTAEPDPTGPWMKALYLVHEPINTNVGIADATSNHYDLLVGPQGNAVVSGSPFA